MLSESGAPICPTCSGDALDHALRSRNVTLTKRGERPAHDFVRGPDVPSIDGPLRTYRCAYCRAAFIVPLHASPSTMDAAMRRAHGTTCPVAVVECVGASMRQTMLPGVEVGR